MLRSYRAEFKTPNGAWESDIFMSRNFNDASERARTVCAKMQPGTRIIGLMELDEYLALINEARRGR